MTKLDRFMRDRKITTVSLAKASRFHRNHIGNLRKGQAEPTRTAMDSIVTALRKLSGEVVGRDDIFEFRPGRIRQ